MKTAARIALLALAALTLALGGASLASGKTQATIHFSFRGYAHNVKVVSPLVGPWQLGVAATRGSGTIGEGTNFHGTLSTENDPKFSRYPQASLRARVIGYRYVAGAHDSFRKLTLTVEVTRATNGGTNCDPGVRGKLTLYDSKAKLSNGETKDYILTQRWTASRCPSFVQGWTNEDGGERTSPHYGGPPHGGQWAIVNISS